MESVEHGVIFAFAWITGDKYNYLKSNLDKNFEELYIDSLDIVEVCIEIEKKIWYRFTYFEQSSIEHNKNYLFSKKRTIPIRRKFKCTF